MESFPSSLGLACNRPRTFPLMLVTTSRATNPILATSRSFNAGGRRLAPLSLWLSFPVPVVACEKNSKWVEIKLDIIRVTQRDLFMLILYMEVLHCLLIYIWFYGGTWQCEIDPNLFYLCFWDLGVFKRLRLGELNFFVITSFWWPVAIETIQGDCKSLQCNTMILNI